MARFRETGSVAAGQMGGHRPKKLIGPWREWLLERCRTADFTLRGLVAELAERGMQVDYRTVWSSSTPRGLTHKKKTLIAAERERPDVARRRARWMQHQGKIDPNRLCSSTRPGPRPTWRRCGAGRRAASAEGLGAAWPLEDDDLPRGAAL